MKDYRLSEIQNHNFNELWALSDDIAKRRLEFEFLRKAQYSLEHLDIEPRDMIELPCKCKSTVNRDWLVYYRSKYDCGLIEQQEFSSEAEADAFLERLKGDKK